MTVTISEKNNKKWQIINPEFRINLEDSHLCVSEFLIIHVLATDICSYVS